MHDSGILLPVPHPLNLSISVFRSVLTAVRTDMLQLPNQMNPSCPARAIIEASNYVLKVWDLSHDSPTRGNHDHSPVLIDWYRLPVRTSEECRI